jgi:predicted metal-binding membrane protein
MALECDRRAAIVLLVALPAVCWIWIAAMARDMYGSMTGASAWMMTLNWDLPHLLLLWAMWAVMMAAMMLPSAAPVVLLYGAVVRRSPAASARHHIYALAGGYLLVWTIFSLGATALQRGLAGLLLLSPMMEVTSADAGGILLLIAGMYQFTPLKHACLRACRSPLALFMTRWRSGGAGAFRMGVEHGIDCLGCCWALMLLLFAGGVMNLAVIAALAALVALEKLAPFGPHGARAGGVLLIATGVAMILR